MEKMDSHAACRELLEETEIVGAPAAYQPLVHGHDRNAYTIREGYHLDHQREDPEGIFLRPYLNGLCFRDGSPVLASRKFEWAAASSLEELLQKDKIFPLNHHAIAAFVRNNGWYDV